MDQIRILFRSLKPVSRMDSRNYLVLLLAIACIAVFTAGCTSPQPATTTPATSAPAATVAKTAAIATTTTSECPDKYEKGVWDYSWDTRWKPLVSGFDIRDSTYGEEGSPDSWNGINAPNPTDLKLTQKCRDVTGTIVFPSTESGSRCQGTVTGKIDKNQLMGSWKTSGCEPEKGISDGTFTINMDAGNKTWTGKLLSTMDLKNNPDTQPNWAARRV
jgi:hypothetical protein